jgi:hypothetical protein
MCSIMLMELMERTEEMCWRSCTVMLAALENIMLDTGQLIGEV